MNTSSIHGCGYGGVTWTIMDCWAGDCSRAACLQYIICTHTHAPRVMSMLTQSSTPSRTISRGWSQYEVNHHLISSSRRWSLFLKLFNIANTPIILIHLIILILRLLSLLADFGWKGNKTFPWVDFAFAGINAATF